MSAMVPLVAAVALLQPMADRHSVTILPEAWERKPLADGRVEFTQSVSRAFDQAILSWNLESGWASADYSLTAFGDGWRSADYRWGTWFADGGSVSVKGQRDDHGRVDTDTLVLRRPAGGLTVRVVATPRSRSSVPSSPGLVAVALSLMSRPERAAAPFGGVARVIEVPRRAQMAYPNGGVLCSPTATSMVLGHWARVLGTPFVDRDMPLVQRGVYDAVYRGCGNWSFNGAYAGSVPGMHAVVGRFNDLADLERCIAAGFPVVCSISNTVVKGQPPEPNDGHLVVLVGFDESGRPVFNDPGRNVVRMTYERENFRKAWATSDNTVYLIWPIGYTPPWL